MQASHVTIRDWLNRLRWDEQMATGHWQLGYYDRVLNRVLPADLMPGPGLRLRGDTVELEAPDGRRIRLPLHRARVLRRDGCVVWERRG